MCSWSCSAKLDRTFWHAWPQTWLPSCSPFAGPTRDSLPLLHPRSIPSLAAMNRLATQLHLETRQPQKAKQLLTQHPHLSTWQLTLQLPHQVTGAVLILGCCPLWPALKQRCLNFCCSAYIVNCQLIGRLHSASIRWSRCKRYSSALALACLLFQCAHSH